LNEANGDTCLPALIRHVNSAGPLIHLELERADDGTAFAVDLTREQTNGNSLRPGTQVFVELKKLRVFSDDYSI
jgi:ABC-type sulfate/molybdate transport systems ATPase subunit